ncbi:MAG: thiol-disulfide isomerase/thioredoxin [Flavobacteriaceae bacterium]|jgi:thiol-disulfide isomerase/thioredoxin|uniref:TlpA family protein disulfide reductase n=1 Tax=Candidatus Marifrigoribacter sp. Uisw_064 TaxID=3230970 RepID=UPI003AD8A58D
MKIIISSILLLFVITIQAQKTSFSSEALNDTFVSFEGNNITFSEILESHKGKTILIDIWAGWCKDCIIGMPKVKELQKKNKDVVFLFLSLDKTQETWKKVIDKYKMEGEHYFIPLGWKSPFCSSIDLDWVPRYMIVNPEGEISLYKAIKADDEILIEILKK